MQNKKTRLTFSSVIKRQMFLEASQGINFKYVVNNHFNKNSNDKKYASKLFYKWKEEIYSHNEILHIFNYELSDEIINLEIKNMLYEDE